MADDFIANPGAGGVTFAGDDIAGVMYPRGKITLGANGVNDGDVSASNPLPVTSGILALESGGNLDLIAAATAASAASLSILDDWDDNNRANVNIITGQNTGAQGGSGAVSATTLRVTLATDIALPAGTNLLGSVVSTNGKTIKTASGSVNSDTDIVAAVGGKRIKVFAIVLSTDSTTLNRVIMKSNGAAGTELWRCLLQAGTGTVCGMHENVTVPSFLFATVQGEKLTLDMSAGVNVEYTVSYWDDDAT